MKKGLISKYTKLATSFSNLDTEEKRELKFRLAADFCNTLLKRSNVSLDNNAEKRIARFSLNCAEALLQEFESEFVEKK